VGCILADESGDIWIGSFEGALARLSGDDWTIYNTDNSGLPSNSIKSLSFIDNKLWIATFHGGMAIFDGTDWTVYDKDNSALPSNNIYSFDVDLDNRVWIGTTAGAVLFDGTSFEVYDVSNSPLLFNYVYDLAVDKYGDKWFVTFQSGITLYNENGISVSVDENTVNHSESIIVYPNPAGDEISLENCNGNPVTQLDLYNLNGQKLLHFDGEVSRLDISKLPHGMYLIKVTTGTEQSTVKFVKK
jgi:ligand-binding sensor domain-containing protein